jgi:hypothetical protein
MEIYREEYDLKMLNLIFTRINDEDKLKKAERLLIDIYTGELSIREFTAHIGLAACKTLEELAEERTKIECKNITPEAIRKRAERARDKIYQAVRKRISPLYDR